MPSEPEPPLSSSSSTPPLSLTFLLLGAGRSAQRRVDDALAPTGFTVRHLGALGHLSRQPDLSYSDLARRAGVTVQSMHATVRQLEERGAVRRGQQGQGRRAGLEVTTHGRRVLRTAMDTFDRLDEELFADVPAERRAELLSLLAGIVFAGNRRAGPDLSPR